MSNDRENPLVAGDLPPERKEVGETAAERKVRREAVADGAQFELAQGWQSETGFRKWRGETLPVIAYPPLRNP